jgi:hypothetical protein
MALPLGFMSVLDTSRTTIQCNRTPENSLQNAQRKSSATETDMTTITLDDGRIFPAYQGAALSWDIGSQFTSRDESEGFPRTSAVIAAMRQHRPDQLERERSSYLKHSFDSVFGHSARKILNLIEVA